MYLCKLLCINAHTQSPPVFAAMALMCLHAARINSRISPEGEIILLAQQDRSQWNRQLIEEGNNWMNKAASGDSLSSYHIEAAIAFEHCIALRFEDTNWQQILSYYDMLVQIHPTPFVALNRMTVVFKISGPAQTLEQLQQSPFLKEWEKHYIYYSLLGEIYSSSDVEKAKANFLIAISLTGAKAEKKLLRKKMEGLDIL